MTVLDDAIVKEGGGVGGRAQTQADVLINLAQSAEFFHGPHGAGFADLDINGHRETWPIRAKGGLRGASSRRRAAPRVRRHSNPHLM